jgi:hypothetical protein
METSFIREIDDHGQVIQIPRVVYEARQFRKRKRIHYIPTEKRRKLNEPAANPESTPITSSVPNDNRAHFSVADPGTSVRHSHASSDRFIPGRNDVDEQEVNEEKDDDNDDDYLHSHSSDNNDSENDNDGNGDEAAEDNEADPPPPVPPQVVPPVPNPGPEVGGPAPDGEIQVRNYQLPPFSRRIADYLFDQHYEDLDDMANCPGCDFVESPQTMIPLRNETRNIFKQKLAEVAVGHIERNARKVSTLYNQWAGQENRRRSSNDLVSDWPEWLVIRHVFLHTNNPLIKVRIEEHIIERNLLYAYTNELRSPMLSPKQRDQAWRVIRDSHEILRKLRTTRYDRMNEFDNGDSRPSNTMLNVLQNMPAYNFIDMLYDDNANTNNSH